MRQNDRLKRVQVGREEDVPLDSNALWFLVIANDGDWDADSNLFTFKENIEKGFTKQVFCIWHGNYRTNLFLMSKEFLLDYFKKQEKKK
jgi:hypothetical protein